MKYSETEADDFVVVDLRNQGFCRAIVDRRFDEVCQLAADMGGAAYIFTGDNQFEHGNLCHKRNIKKIFYSSSACCITRTIVEPRIAWTIRLIRQPPIASTAG